MDQNSRNNRMIWRDRESTRVWITDIPGTKELYLAMLNLKSKLQGVTFSFLREGLTDKYKEVKDLWNDQYKGLIEKDSTCNLNPHASAVYRLVKVERSH